MGLLISDLHEKNAAEIVPLYRFWQPRFWPLWLGLLVLRILILLPYRWQMALGRVSGRLLARFIPERQKIAAANLRLCFPELSDSEKDLLVRITSPRGMRRPCYSKPGRVH